MAKYATYELSELLRALTPDQRQAIGRIVRHVYLDNKPLAHLFGGDKPICSENTYYKKGFLDEATGEWRKQGWSHQPKFVAALEMASRLALQAEQSEDLHYLRKARQKAMRLAPAAVGVWADVMTDKKGEGKDRNQAAKHLLDLAFKDDQGDGSEETQGAAGDWWGAAFDE